MNKFIRLILFAGALSTLGSSVALAVAGADASVVVPPNTTENTSAIQGANKNGKITLVSSSSAIASVFESCPSGNGLKSNVLVLGGLGGTISKSYYMSSSCTYSLVVKAYDSQAKGYIRNYE